MAAINANLLTMVEDTVTSSGVKFTSTLDGGIRVVGTATGSSEFWFSSTIGGNNKNPVKVDNGTYTLSAEGLTGSLRLIMSGGGGNGFAYTELYSTSAPKVSVVSNGSKPFNYFLLRVNAGEVLDTTVYAKLEAGETATPWQPYANDTSGGGAVMSDDIITLGYNGRGGRICWTYDMLASHIGEACTLSFWARFDSDAAMLKYAVIYPYQENGIAVAKHAYGEGSNPQAVTLTDEWQYFEYSGTVMQLQDIAGYSAGEMFIWCSANNGGPNIQLAGIMLTLAGGGASMSSTGRNLATNSKAMGSPAYKTNMHVAGYGNGTQLVTREDGLNEIVTIGNWQGLHHYANGTLPQAGESFTTSCNVRNDRESACRVYMMMFAFNASGTHVYPPFSIALEGSPATQTDNKYITLAAGEERRLTATVGWTEEAAALLEAGGNIRYSWQALGANVAFWAYKLEYGTAATPWRPAPEDTEQPSDVVYASEGVDLGDTSGLANGISALDGRMTAAEADIDTLDGSIALKANASDVYTKQESTALLEVKANKATLTSEINASADTVKIDATRVNIEGAAIFTGSGRLSQDSLNNAYDASGAASGAVNALKTDLASSTGTTVINGGHIETGSLTVGHVSGLQNTLNGKADDADVTAAISTAAADATSKANAAQAAAESTAAADATTKANAAQAAAEATASADATSKANDAKKYATNYIALDPVNGIRIADANPDTATTYQKQTATETEFVVEGVSMAEFGGSGARIGGSTSAHVTIGDRNMQFVDEISNPYLDIHISPAAKVVTGATLTARGDGSTKRFTLGKLDDNTRTEMINASSFYGLVNGSSVSAWIEDAYSSTSGYTGSYLVFQNAPASGATLSYKYTTAAFASYRFGSGAESQKALGVYGTAFGNSTEASGRCAIAAGSYSDASGNESVAAGWYSKASGNHAIALGQGAKSSGTASTSLGYMTEATAQGSVAMGQATKATASGAQAQNNHTVASSADQTVVGRYNIEDTGEQYAFIVGNGTSSYKKNAFTVDWQGNGKFTGNATDGNGNAISSHSHPSGTGGYAGLFTVAGRTAYPLFVYATAPDEADLPITPCFVLATSDYGLWYYDGN